MSKLSESLKALINSPLFRPHATPAPKGISSLFSQIAHEASSKDVGLPAWLAFSSAATMTMNSPESLLALHNVAISSSSPPIQPTAAAELIREVGLKCISFNGIPRTINCLGAFYSGLPPEVASALTTQPTRQLSPSNVERRMDDGARLWKSIYLPLDEKLMAKLARSHPDLPIVIQQGNYAMTLSNPPTSTSPIPVGRVLTSLVAIACLRAQTGVGPQVVSHVFGLRKAFEDGTAEVDVQGGRWLASDEGTMWLLRTVDRIVEVIGEGKGTTVAPGYKAKL